MIRVTKRVLWVAALALQGCSGESELEPREVELRLGSSEQALSAHTRGGWPLAGADQGASGFNAAEHTLTPKRVGELEPLWLFDSARAGTRVAPIHATPVVDGRGSTFVGDVAGTFFAIDRDGELLWSFTTEPPTALLSPLVSNPRARPRRTRRSSAPARSPRGGLTWCSPT